MGFKITMLNNFLTNETINIIMLILIIIFLCFGIGVKRLNKTAIDNSVLWLQGDIQRFSTQKDIEFSSKFDSYDKKLKNRLQTQFDNIRERAKTHQTIMIYYYSRYYMAITMATVTGIVAALMMMIISKNGWENTNNYIVAIFLTTSGIATYFASFPTIFEQKNNIEQNTLFSISKY